MARKTPDACELNMTPMIDVVFQLIIFFIVTIKMEQQKNETIRLEEAKHGPVVEGEDKRMLVIEVDRHGWISIHNAQLTRDKLEELMRARYNRHGEFPVMIWADARAQHQHVRGVMDTCTKAGIWRITFAAVKEGKSSK
jgi:biopolymer transport protein ExbD